MIKFNYIYCILLNTHAGVNTEKSRGARAFRSKSINVERIQGIPELAVWFLMREDQAFMHVMRTQLTEIKWLLVILESVTVKSCERVLFFVYIWIISWDATNKSLTQRYTDR